MARDGLGSRLRAVARTIRVGLRPSLSLGAIGTATGEVRGLGGAVVSAFATASPPLTPITDRVVDPENQYG